MLISSIMFFVLLLMNPTQNDEAVKALLEKKLADYENTIKSKDIEKLLDMFGPDGSYGNAKDRHEIRMTLASYLNNEIIDFDLTTVKFTMTPTLVNHTGTFKQDIVMNGYRKKNNGSFRIVWNKYADGWKIQHMSMTKDVSQ